ncbi:hypothetical protein [Brevirhabdus sp.]|uniref:hypothetical protein n=1 Tax=Brevirhabdus sp. TaxID=2004514 RepID=UPI004059B960
MKPNFALDLSHDGINLLLRGRNGWLRVGEVALDDPDMNQALRMLRRSAADLAQGGLSSKLLIPNSQILYTRLRAPGPDDDSRRAQIRAALEGRTPYDVDDLVFDFVDTSEPQVMVAVVARATLQEAEDFATEHRLNPVSFAARPDPARFAGEPFFGETRYAATILNGAAVERDTTPVVVRGAASSDPSAFAEAGAEAGAEGYGAASSPPPASDAEPAEDLGGPSGAGEAGSAVSERDARVERDAAKGGDGDPTPPPADDAPPRAAADLDEAKRASAAAPRAESEEAAPVEPERGFAEAPTAFSFRSRRDAGAKDGSTPPSLDQISSRILKLAEAERRLYTPVPPKTPGAAPLTSAEKPDRTSVDLAEPVARGGDAPRGTIETRTSATGATRDKSTATAGAQAFTEEPADKTDAAIRPADGTGQAAAGRLNASDAGASSDTDRGLGALRATRSTGADSRIAPLPELPETSPPVAAHRVQAPRRPAFSADDHTPPHEPPPAPHMLAGFMARSANLKSGRVIGAAKPDPEAEAMTVFGARQSQRPQRNRTGLLLTAVLVLVLIAVAALSSMYLAPSVANLFRDPAQLIAQAEPPAAVTPSVSPADDTATALVETTAVETTVRPVAPAKTPPAPQAQPVTEIVARAEASDMQIAAVAPAKDTGTAALDTLNLAGAPRGRSAVGNARASRQSSGRLPTTRETERRYAATGIWLLPPRQSPTPSPRTEVSDGIVLASIDPVNRSQDALALPDVLRDTQDTPYGVPPLPSDTTASPAGATDTARALPADDPSPNADLRDRAGPPPVVNAASTAKYRPIYRPRTATATAAGADTAGPDAPAAAADTSATTSGSAPGSTPGSAPASAAASIYAPTASRPVVSAAKAGDPRPLPRPGGAARPADAPGAAGGTSANAPDAKPDLENATKQAVAASAVPVDRPNNLREAFARLQAAREKEAAAARARARKTNTQIATTPTVARQATTTNAIQLGQVSLIGVYGSPSKRRALVRLPSGRFVKVEVGDKLDGARVSGIGADSLRLKKGSRDMVLRMPKG